MARPDRSAYYLAAWTGTVAILGAVIGGGASYLVAKTQISADNQRSAEATLQNRASTYISSVQQIAQLSVGDKGGTNKTKILAIESGLQAQFYVLLLSSTDQNQVTAATELEANTLYVTSFAESGSPPPKSDFDNIEDGIARLADSINPDLNLATNL